MRALTTAAGVPAGEQVAGNKGHVSRGGGGGGVGLLRYGPTRQDLVWLSSGGFRAPRCTPPGANKDRGLADATGSASSRHARGRRAPSSRPAPPGPRSYQNLSLSNKAGTFQFHVPSTGPR